MEVGDLPFGRSLFFVSAHVVEQGPISIFSAHGTDGMGCEAEAAEREGLPSLPSLVGSSILIHLRGAMICYSEVLCYSLVADLHLFRDVLCYTELCSAVVLCSPSFPVFHDIPWWVSYPVLR